MEETGQEPSDYRTTLDLLESIGYADARRPETSSSEKLTSGIAWCIATINGVNPQLDAVPHEILIEGSEIDNWGRLREDLRSTGCPFSLPASPVERLDDEAVFLVVQWLATRIYAMSKDSKRKDTCTRLSSEEKEYSQPVDMNLKNAQVSIKDLNEELDELNQKKATVLKELQHLRERISKADATDVVHKLISCSKTLKDFKKQESEFDSTCNAKRSELRDEIIELEERVARGYDCSSFSSSLDHSIVESEERLNSGKKALASILKTTLALKRLIDDMPTQSELIQYERRISELYVNIQGKHKQTRRYYATYNALLETKDLMLKEISLLNSISSQLQGAVTSPNGQSKLVDSMEGILKGIQQKLHKVQLSEQEEQQTCDSLKERYATATAEQRRCYTLLKAFQEECAKNERLRSQNSM